MKPAKGIVSYGGYIICPDKGCRTENGNWRTRCRKCKRRLHPTARSTMNMPDPIRQD